MSISTVFSGVSSYASDLQQVITRAVAIASMPLNLLNSQRSDMTAQRYALNNLDTAFAALQTAVEKLDSTTGSGCLSGASSDPSSVAVSVAAGAQEGEYTVNVTNAGSTTSTISKPGLSVVADPSTQSISSATAFTLTVDGNSFDIEAADGSMSGLVQAINESNAGVRASLVNLGSPGSPEYRLLIRSDKLGPVSVSLRDGASTDPNGTELLDTLSTGAMATYTVQGLDPVESDSRTVTLAPGVTIDLLHVSTDPVTIAVQASTSSLSDAFSSFVSAYNEIVTQLGQQVGQTAGALCGRPIVRSLSASLRQIILYSSGVGSVSSLPRLGVEVDRSGMLSFDSSKLEAQSPSAVASFLGRISGGGFLKAAADAVASVEDSESGLVKSEIELTTEEISRQDGLITEAQNRICDLQESLQQKMSEADALLATLESKRDYMNNLFTAMMKTSSSSK